MKTESQKIILNTQHWIAISIVLIVVGASSFFSKNHAYINSDPLGTLTVSEQLLNHGTVRLDAYGNSLGLYGARIHQKNGHSYNYFPLGTALASLPVVAVLKLVGVNIQYWEPLIQVGMTAVTSALIFGLLVRLAIGFVSPWQALLISAIFWFGTSLSSTAGTALWSHNFAVIFSLTAMILMLGVALRKENSRWVLISICIFAAYLCRPTMSLFGFMAIGFVGTYNRGIALKMIGLNALLILAFMFLSQSEFGQILPDYYLPGRLGETPNPDAWFGNLFSPARGLLVFSPFIATVWLCKGWQDSRWPLKWSWLLMGLVWPVLHLLIISRFSPWWGGHAFGSRLTTDILPGLFLLTLYAWPRASPLRSISLAPGIFTLSCVFSLYVHTVQGLMNEYSSAWNRQPDIDQNPQYLFDWSYPQFLSSEEGHLERIQRAKELTQPPLH